MKVKVFVTCHAHVKIYLSPSSKWQILKLKEVLVFLAVLGVGWMAGAISWPTSHTLWPHSSAQCTGCGGRDSCITRTHHTHPESWPWIELGQTLSTGSLLFLSPAWPYSEIHPYCGCYSSKDNQMVEEKNNPDLLSIVNLLRGTVIFISFDNENKPSICWWTP